LVGFVHDVKSLNLLFLFSTFSKWKPGVENTGQGTAGLISLAGIIFAPPGIDNDCL